VIYLKNISRFFIVPAYKTGFSIILTVNHIVINYGDVVMNYKKISLRIIIVLFFAFFFNSILNVITTPKVIGADIPIDTNGSSENRGVPAFDYIIGDDNWPHYRVFYWVKASATHFAPYADKGVNTDVSEHGPAAKWSVVSTSKIINDERLVFIYVPKTFVFLFGKDFYNVIHLSYY